MRRGLHSTAAAAKLTKNEEVAISLSLGCSSMYEQFLNGDNEKLASDEEAAKRLFLEAIAGPPPTGSRLTQEPLFGPNADALIKELPKVFLSQEPKTASTRSASLSSGAAIAADLVAAPFSLGKHHPINKSLEKIMAEQPSIETKIYRSLELKAREAQAQAMAESYLRRMQSQAGSGTAETSKLEANNPVEKKAYLKGPMYIAGGLAAGAASQILLGKLETPIHEREPNDLITIDKLAKPVEIDQGRHPTCNLTAETRQLRNPFLEQFPNDPPGKNMRIPFWLTPQQELHLLSEYKLPPKFKTPIKE